jgi:hypothetical protein
VSRKWSAPDVLFISMSCLKQSLCVAMSGGTQIVHTVCMDTRDCTKRDSAAGTFRFRLAGDNPRLQAVKVSLGSLEFPIVQWTVEELWNRIYFCEGYRLQPDSAWLRLGESVDANRLTSETTIHIPLSLNAIVSVRDDVPGWMRVCCEHVHGLWTDEGACVIPAIDWGDVEIICSGFGRVSLTLLQRAGKLHYLSATEFLMPSPEKPSKHGGFVHVPTFPSPTALCEVGSHILQHTRTLSRYRVAYDARANRATFEALAYPAEAQTLQVCLHGSPLARMLGYVSNVHERVFNRPGAGRFGAGNPALGGYDFYAEQMDHPPLRLASETLGGWHFTELTAGWYGPAHRPMCTGNPMRLTDELESCLNRLFFPSPERIPQGTVTAHFLLFKDPTGAMHSCPIYVGRYTAQAICAALETEMTRLAHGSLPGTVFSVDYDVQIRRFTFCCEVADAELVRPAPFSLLFHHPASVDASRFGFEPVALYGRDTYTSCKDITVPSEEGLLRPPCNIYRVSEVGHQKRLRFAPAPLPLLTGLILGYDARAHILRLRMYAGQLPCAHGFAPGDVVHITASPPTAELFKFSVQDGWTPETANRCPIAPMWGLSGVVVPPSNTTREPRFPNSEQVDLSLRVRPTPDLADCCGMTLGVGSDVQPFNLCFGLTNSLPARSVGFPLGATQWGIDGASLSGTLRLPPFDAPAVHCLDHPDYVLVYLEEGKTGTSLQHQCGNNTTTPFCKLVLYPLFREERMLPRDTTLLSGESLSHFTLRFTNPDGTPYQFHKVEFSFSLNFVRVHETRGE